MIDRKYRILKSGVSMDDATELEEGISKSLGVILDDIEYEPEDRDKLEDALRDECYKHIIEHANLNEEPTDEEIRFSFDNVLSDFTGDSYKSRGKSSLSVLLGSRSAVNDSSDPSCVKRDIVFVSGSLLEKKYGNS